MILADENITQNVIASLRAYGFVVVSIKESNKGLTDISITQLSLNPPQIILTRDKDFGDLAFLHKVKMTGCILLRYIPNEENTIIDKLISFLSNQNIKSLNNKFVAITVSKIRIIEFSN